MIDGWVGLPDCSTAFGLARLLESAIIRPAARVSPAFGQDSHSHLARILTLALRPRATLARDTFGRKVTNVLSLGIVALTPEGRWRLMDPRRSSWSARARIPRGHPRAVARDPRL